MTSSKTAHDGIVLLALGTLALAAMPSANGTLRQCARLGSCSTICTTSSYLCRPAAWHGTLQKPACGSLCRPTPSATAGRCVQGCCPTASACPNSSSGCVPACCRGAAAAAFQPALDAAASMPLPVLNGWAKRWRAWRDSPFRRATNEAAADADRTLWHMGSIVLLVLLVFKTVAQERLVGV